MIATIDALPQNIINFISSSHSVGDNGRSLDRYLSSIQQHRDDSVSLGWRRQLKNDTSDLTYTCRVENWDNDGADAINNVTLMAAYKLIDGIPDEVAMPEITPEIDGGISFDWNFGKNKILSISILDRKITFAAVLGDCLEHGETPFYEELPFQIKSILLKYFRQR